MTSRLLGFWSSTSLAAIGVGYLLVLSGGFAKHGLHEPITDPILAIMEILTLLSAPVIVCLFAALHDRAQPTRRVHGLTALAFGILFAGLTSCVHLSELTAVRPSGGGSLVWPSPAYAVELLAWDVFLGLALLFAAATLDGDGRERAARRTLRLAGVLCLAGTIGPVLGDMRLQLVGVLGYAGVLPICACLLARVFARPA